jgi:hypothetical protein
VILDFNGEVLLGLLGWDSLGDSPRFQNAIDCETKIIMQSGGVMFLGKRPRDDL